MNKGNQPLVGIALPVYNRVNYFRECLEHIQDQTYTNWICYITDNACTDGSSEIAEEFVAKDSRFKIFRNSETLVAYKNWNVALGHFADCDVKYLKFECSDDWMFPNYLEEMVTLLESNEDIGVAYAYSLAGNYVKCDGLDIYQGNVFEGKDILKKSILERLYLTGGLAAPIYRTSILKQIDPNLQVINENNINCDVELNDKVLLLCKAGFVYKVLTYYRFHEGQIFSFAKKMDTVKVDIERRLYMLKSIFPDLELYYRAHRLEYAMFLLDHKRKGNMDVLEWHFQHLKRPITDEEYKAAKKYYLKQKLREFKMCFIRICSILIS